MEPIDHLRQRMLVLRCQLGDRQALGELIEHHNRALGYYLRRMLGREDAIEVQQEVWLTVIRRIGQLKSPEAFVVWLFQIGRRKAISLMSERDRFSTIEVDELVDVEDLGEDFDADQAAQIHRELANLNVKHREVLLLRFLEELSYEQIAEVMECTVGTVRSRLHYAKIALRERLERVHEQAKHT